jgi:hypothetical protein
MYITSGFIKFSSSLLISSFVLIWVLISGFLKLPIGNLTSQLFANVFAGIFDRFIKQTLKIKCYIRYMDDTLILHNSKNELKFIKEKLEKFALDYMKLKFSKWYILPSTRGINFVGYRVWRNYILIRKSSVVQSKRKIKRYLLSKDYDALNKFLASWKGHVQWASHHNLIKSIETKFNL